MPAKLNNMTEIANKNPAKLERNLTIAEQRLQGATYRELAKEFNLSKAGICHILNNDAAVKDVIETGTKEMLSLVPKAVDNYRTFLTSNNEKIRYDSSKDILQTNRIMDAHATNLYFQNIYNDNRTLITPDVSVLLGMLSGKAAIDESDIIDAELLPDPL